jgi:hypothetical protein
MVFDIDKVVYFAISVALGMFCYSFFGFEPTIIIILLFIITKMEK